MEFFIGSVLLFAGNFAPRGWSFCQGQLLSIAQNTALFSILGTTYGGDGITTFALPDLRGRAAVSQGTGPGLQPVDLGEVGGSQGVTLTINEMPAHSHGVQCDANALGSATPVGVFPGNPGIVSGTEFYGPTASGLMAPTMITPTGGNQPIPTQSPFLALNYIICLEGVFPSRG